MPQHYYLLDTLVRSGYNETSKSTSWKVLETVLSHLKTQNGEMTKRHLKMLDTVNPGCIEHFFRVYIGRFPCDQIFQFEIPGFVFRALSLPQTILSEQQFRALERFVVIMYSRTSPHQDVNHARQSMLSQGTRSIESIPPTQAARLGTTCQEGSISSRLCLGANTSPYAGTSKCSRLGMESIFGWLDSDLVYPS